MHVAGFIKPGFHIAARLEASEYCAATISWLKCRKMPVTMPVTKDRMKTMRDRTKEDNDLPAAAAEATCFHIKFSWLKMP